MRRALLCVLAGWLSACHGVQGGDGEVLMRMYEQKKVKPFAPSPVFADGHGMRMPPAGTVPRDAELEWRVKPPFTAALLEKGRHRFNIVCAACHGHLGDGNSRVATHMALAPPPSFHTLGERTDEHLFAVIGKGFGLMPAFPDISLEERWGIVGYVRALQLSQHAPLSMAPPAERERLLREGMP